jgi:hypothetical protein
LLLTIDVQIFHNLLSRGTKLPHTVRLKTDNGEFPAVIDFLKQFEKYIRVEGIITANEEQKRFELNFLNSEEEAQIKV